MASFRFLCFSLVSLAVLQAGCTTASPPTAYRSSATSLDASCDRSVKYIDVVARITNTTNQVIEFNLDDNRGPPYDPWWQGYRVHSAPPGEYLGLVHASGHDSVWDRTIAIAPGSSADFNVPLFGLRPDDYLNWHTIELRDARGRSYWTRQFSLCSVSRPKCNCPQRAY